MEKAKAAVSEFMYDHTSIPQTFLKHSSNKLPHPFNYSVLLIIKHLLTLESSLGTRLDTMILPYMKK